MEEGGEGERDVEDVEDERAFFRAAASRSVSSWGLSGRIRGFLECRLGPKAVQFFSVSSEVGWSLGVLRSRLPDRI